MTSLTWTPVPGFEHIEVTRCGLVRSAAYEVTRMSRHGTLATYRFQAKQMRVWQHSNGYLRCAVQRQGRRAPVYHHRLIALTFVSGYVDGYHVNHINGVKTDNRPENLEWVPIDENTRHQWRTGLVDLRGERSATARLTAARVRAIRRALADGAKPSTLAVIAGVSHGTVLSIQRGASWQSVLGAESALA